MAFDRSRRPSDARSTAEAAFKAATRPAAPPLPVEPRAAVVPGAKEQVSLRLDREVLEHFQADGPGWQDRINAALRALIGK